jgi:hypothetical protein
MKNHVKFNIGDHGTSDDLPNPGKPIVEINGLAIEMVKAFSIKASAEGQTEVSVTFYAKVEGELFVEAQFQ